MPSMADEFPHAANCFLTIGDTLLNQAGVNHYDPDSKVHGANTGPTWVLSAPDGPHVGPMNLAIRGGLPKAT